MAAAMATVLLLLGLAPRALPLQVWAPAARTVALLFQPVRMRCSYETSAPEPPPLVTWKFLAPCASPTQGGGVGSAPGACADGAARTQRIVASKQGGTVTVGEFYRGRGVTIEGEANLDLGPAAWGDSGFYVCTVNSIQDLEGNNEAVAELLVLGSLPEGTGLFPGIQLGALPDWLFVVLVLLGAALVALGLGLCWCQCCPHTCCCLLRCPCCPQRCCCPEALYLAGKAATSGGVSITYGPPPPSIALHSLESSHSSQVPLLRDVDGSVVSGRLGSYRSIGSPIGSIYRALWVCMDGGIGRGVSPMCL
ncbi:lipolysis-stimulated lipoprotein receptor-like [Melopsittacus undulatus]|uniref:lipolysis-stimulated lipoprotein receptor-like n=1 Tax=Melopsittacus undulatus TaxID=13146 RepID=UPI001469B27F|nr:lipolysis-stimulated lipoprotein receptor-like [Melopsittacus undulatus]